MPLPAWLALIVQVPVVKTVIIVPVTVQVDVLAEVKETVKLEEAVAESIGAVPPSVIGDKSKKVMDWVPSLTVIEKVAVVEPPPLAAVIV